MRWLVRQTRITVRPPRVVVDGAATPDSCRSATSSAFSRSISAGERPASAEAEADDVERDRRHQLEAVGLGDSRRQVAGLAAVALDRRPEPPRAVLLEREPDLERAKAARQLGPVVAEPGIAAGEAARVAAQIVGRHGERRAMQVAAAHQHAAGVVGHVQPLVEVESQGVGALDAGEARLERRR